MTTAALPPTWSRRRWAVTISVVFLGQMALVMLLGDHSRAARKPAPRFDMVLAECATLPDSPAWDDPTLFALAHPRGFSGQAWLRVPPQPHQYFEWSEEWSWLTPNSARLGAELARAIHPLEAERARIEKPVPASVLPAGLEESLPWARHSVLRVEGELGDQDLRARPKLPMIGHNGLLPPSLVQATVDELGRVFAASLVAESGSKVADLRAVQLARSLQFAELQPRARGTTGRHFRFARLVFQWHTTPPRAGTVPAKP